MKTELIECLGTDLTVVNAARVSFDKESKWDKDVPFTGQKVLSDRDGKLIKYLARHKHFTPFTHCSITLRETVPIFVARQRFKHTVGFSYNEVSRRYVDNEPEFFVPEFWRGKADNKKQGSSQEPLEYQKTITSSYEDLMEKCREVYNSFLNLHGVCPEQARMLLPQSMYTSYYVTGSLFAFARAYMLRSTDDAQYEIRTLANNWNKIIKPLYPVSWSALVGDK